MCLLIVVALALLVVAPPLLAVWLARLIACLLAVALSSVHLGVNQNTTNYTNFFSREKNLHKLGSAGQSPK